MYDKLDNNRLDYKENTSGKTCNNLETFQKGNKERKNSFSVKKTENIHNCSQIYPLCYTKRKSTSKYSRENMAQERLKRIKENLDKKLKINTKEDKSMTTEYMNRLNAFELKIPRLSNKLFLKYYDKVKRSIVTKTQVSELSTICINNSKINKVKAIVNDQEAEKFSLIKIPVIESSSDKIHTIHQNNSIKRRCTDPLQILDDQKTNLDNPNKRFKIKKDKEINLYDYDVNCKLKNSSLLMKNKEKDKDNTNQKLVAESIMKKDYEVKLDNLTKKTDNKLCIESNEQFNYNNKESNADPYKKYQRIELQNNNKRFENELQIKNRQENNLKRKAVDDRLKNVRRKIDESLSAINTNKICTDSRMSIDQNENSIIKNNAFKNSFTNSSNSFKNNMKDHVSLFSQNSKPNHNHYTIPKRNQTNKLDNRLKLHSFSSNNDFIISNKFCANSLFNENVTNVPKSSSTSSPPDNIYNDVHMKSPSPPTISIPDDDLMELPKSIKNNYSFNSQKFFKNNSFNVDPANVRKSNRNYSFNSFDLQKCTQNNILNNAPIHHDTSRTPLVNNGYFDYDAPRSPPINDLFNSNLIYSSNYHKTTDKLNNDFVDSSKFQTFTPNNNFTFKDSESTVNFMNRKISSIRDETTYLASYEDLSNDIEMSYNLPQGDILLIMDTNILLSHLKFVNTLLRCTIPPYRNPIVVIPWLVIQEIDWAMKKNDNRLTSHARLANNFIHECLKKNHPRFFAQSLKDFKEIYKNCPNIDDFILHYGLNFVSLKYQVILITDDINLCNKAMINQLTVFTKTEFQTTFNIK